MDATERVVIELVEQLGPGDDGFVCSADVLDGMEGRETEGSRAEHYALLIRMARPGSAMLQLLEGRGNFGAGGMPPADPPYTECRLNSTGVLVLREGQGDALGLPVDLINGDMTSGGNEPSFDPDRVLSAALRLLDEPEISDLELIAAIGAPRFPTGCEVEGSFDKLLGGEAVELLLSARVTVSDDARGRVLVLSGLPPTCVPEDVEDDLVRLFYRNPPGRPAGNVESSFLYVRQIGDPHCPSVEGVFSPSANERDVLDRITSVDGIVEQRLAQLPQPAASTLRSWTAALGAERARRNIEWVLAARQ